MHKEWWAPLTGVVFVVLLIGSFIVGGEPPDSGEPVNEIVEHYKDNKDNITIAMVMFLLSGLALAYFGAIWRKIISDAEDRTATETGRAGGVLPFVALAGLILLLAGAAFDSTLQFAMAEAVDDVEPTAIQTMQAIWDNDFVPMALGILLYLSASGLAILRTGVLPKWLGWVALALVVIGPTPAGFVAFMGAGIWTLIVSIMLTLQRRKTPAAATPTPAI